MLFVLTLRQQVARQRNIARPNGRHQQRLNNPITLRMAAANAVQLSAQRCDQLNRLDGAALLWRLHLLGADVGTRWLDVAQGWDLSPEFAGLSAFNDVHAVWVLVGQQRLHDATDLVAEVERRALNGNVSETLDVIEVALPLLRGMLAFGREDFAEAVRLIDPLQTQLHRIGGSHAQRDGIGQTLLMAAIRSGNVALSSTLLAQRRDKQQTPLTQYLKG